uniref:Diphthamide biosynthesis protein 3 n=1 Tax=Oreochromis aureus TaxID=47969 RepID=A0AAZ1X2S7_OREAU
MSVFHDEVEIEDFEYDEDTETYYFPCPCGDRFAITKEDLENGEEVATCPSCSLIVKVIYDKDLFQRPRFNHFPFPISTLCSSGAGKRQTFTASCISSRFILNEITLDPDEIFQKTQGHDVHVFDGLPADYVGGRASSRGICCEQMKVAL